MLSKIFQPLKKPWGLVKKLISVLFCHIVLKHKDEKVLALLRNVGYLI